MPSMPPRVPQELPPMPSAVAPAVARPEPPGLVQQAAKASWVAPLVAISLGVVTMGLRDKNPGAAMLIGAVNSLLILAGLVLAIVALLCVAKYGRRGVLAPALVGLLINGALVFFLIIGFRAALRARTQAAIAGSNQVAADAVAARETLRREAEQDVSDLKTSPGWIGVLRDGKGVTIVIATAHDDSAFTRDVRSDLGTELSMAVLSIDNTPGDAEMSVDTSAVTFQLDGGREVSVPNPRTVLAAAKRAPDRWLADYAPPYTVAPGAQLEGKPIFFDAGDVDLAALRSATISVNGHPVPIEGRFYTAEEKARLFERAKERPATHATAPPAP